MEDISDLKIVGIDEQRPPLVRKEPYIDLVFQLSQEPPADWCADFNHMVQKLEPSIRIHKENRWFIETYVREMTQIPACLELLKSKVAACNAQYLERTRQEARDEAERVDRFRGEEGPQGKLNKIIASLDFD